MKFFSSLLTLVLIVSVTAFSTTTLATDTTIKCTCTCTDSVGSFKRSCYSTSDCTVCCGYKRKFDPSASDASARKGVVPNLIETPKGDVDMTPMEPERTRAQPNPQILGIEAGCFMQGEQPFNVLIKVGPGTTSYRFVFTNTATQQTAYDQVRGIVHPGQTVPFRLPTAGTYHLTVKYAPNVANQTPAESTINFAVHPVMAVTQNGQKICRDATPVAPPKTRPAPR